MEKDTRLDLGVAAIGLGILIVLVNPIDPIANKITGGIGGIFIGSGLVTIANSTWLMINKIQKRRNNKW